jgi:hypothetical protein
MTAWNLRTKLGSTQIINEMKAARKLAKKNDKGKISKSNNGHPPGGKVPVKPAKGESYKCTIGGKQLWVLQISFRASVRCCCNLIRKICRIVQKGKLFPNKKKNTSFSCCFELIDWEDPDNNL